MIDIIIPVLNEERILYDKRKYYLNLRQYARIIFVDGGSDDKTVELASRYGKVVRSSKGRSTQKNLGAQSCGGQHLLFLHVDTFVDENGLASIEEALNNGHVGGCLSMRIDDHGAMFRIYETIVNLRAKLFGVIDGDLGTFVCRDAFDEVGGFDALPVMEDLLFGQKLKKLGRLAVLPRRILVSSRKWHQRGFVMTFLEYAKAYWMLWTGQFSPPKEAMYYSRAK